MFISDKNNKLNMFFDNEDIKAEKPAFQVAINEDGKPSMLVGDLVVDEDHPIEPPVEPFKVKIGDVKYDTLAEAVEAAIDGDLIEVGEDIEGAGIGLWVATPKDITIDFGEHSYLVVGPAVGSTGTTTQAFHLEKGSKLVMKNGTIDATPAAESNVKMMVQNYCDLVLDNMIINGTDDTGYVVSNNFGSLEVNDSNIIAADGKVAFDLWFGMSSKGEYDNGITVTVNGGEIVGTVEYGAKNKTRVPEWIDRTALVINGGHFTGAFAKSSDFTDKANVTINGGEFDDPSWDEFK